MKRFDTSTGHGAKEALKYLNDLVKDGAYLEIKRIKKTRSNQTNRALHLYFTFISDELRELGTEFTYQGVKGMELSVPYTPEIVKDYFWRPIQRALFNKESTTQLTHDELNEIIQIINRFFADKGVDIVFPSIESLINEQL